MRVKRKSNPESKSLLSYYGFTKAEQRRAKKYEGIEKQSKPIVSEEKLLLSEYEREISQLSKHLSRKITESLLKESQEHPVGITGCIKKTNELFKKQRVINNSILVGFKNVDEIIDKIAKSPADFLILLAYCSKPLECPFGRFSEKCEPADHPICNKCSFRNIVLKTKKIGCKCFIVTKDNLMFSRYLLPRFQDFIQSKKYKPLMTVGCAWATNRFLKAAVIFGSTVIAYKFINGSCKNFKDYRKAEIGKMEKITKLNQKNWQEINYILDKAIRKIQYIRSHKHD